MEDLIMIPTKDVTIKRINDMSEQDYKKVAFYVQSVTENQISAKSEEVASLTEMFNKKYENVFRALAK